jgi:hypothetical protein
MEMVQALESRQMMSVSLATNAQLASYASAYVVSATAPKVKGVYKGVFEDKGYKANTRIAIHIQSQSGYSISGKVTDNQGGVLYFKGTVHSNRTFVINAGNTNSNYYRITGSFSSSLNYINGYVRGVIAGKASYGAYLAPKIR